MCTNLNPKEPYNNNKSPFLHEGSHTTALLGFTGSATASLMQPQQLIQCLPQGAWIRFEQGSFITN